MGLGQRGRREAQEGVKEQTANHGVTVIHIGCGMDSRVLRAGENCSMWYDVDFPEVIEERRRY